MNVEVNEEVLREKLRVENPEFQKWEQEHRKLEDTLMSFESHRYLTPEEEMERKRIQKLKLAAKDRMMEILRRSRVGQA
ncbi:MAG TPA: DUF465 domain-containing protein [Nitrospirota bacterium]|jgi:uncharacterized protein YdcH (DUF465 family)|nr:DUF465 domain-containing protein [Nitrospirota bacterium]HSA78884.1 DUF465 domain-containing protein [Nitrospirota bacterium]